MHTTTCTSLTTYSATSPDQRSSTELRSSSVPHRPPTRRHRCHRGSGLAQPRLGHARFGPRGGQIRPSPLLPPPSAASATASCPKMHGSRQIWTYMARFGCPPCSLCHRSGMGACQHWVGRRAKPPVASHLKKRRKGKKREKEEGREGKGGRGGGRWPPPQEAALLVATRLATVHWGGWGGGLHLPSCRERRHRSPVRKGRGDSKWQKSDTILFFCNIQFL